MYSSKLNSVLNFILQNISIKKELLSDDALQIDMGECKMELAKYHSQVIKDIDHYVTRTKVGNILKAEQKEITEDNKKVMTFDLIIQLKKNEVIKIEGKNNEYSFIISINGNDVYKSDKCNSRDQEFRDSIKDSSEFINFINCFDSLGKIFKKKRKK